MCLQSINIPLNFQINFCKVINTECCGKPLWSLYFHWAGCEGDGKNMAVETGKTPSLYEV